MPLKLDIKKLFGQRSERAKGVDIHPTEPWFLANLYTGNVCIWNYNDQSLVKSFEVSDLPVRTSKFVARKQWVVTGADDMFVRVYNYNTMDKVIMFEAHSDYIRSIAVHPTQPYMLTASDDMFIKLWDWEKGWQCTQLFEGHSHYVMQVVFNPKDTNTFATASLDRTIKVWSLGVPVPNFTLEGHEKGVNCVEYFSGGDRPYLLSGADDKAVKVWDYQTRQCIQTLEGHSHNVSCVAYHPELPIIITGSEDGSVRIWQSTTYRLENTLNYGMERVWALAYQRGTNNLAMGFDEGVVLLSLGREEPVVSMDASGKIIWARHNEIQSVSLKSLGAEYDLADGERLPLAVKELGSTDMYPQLLMHNPNGRFVVVCGDGEYIVYTALAWRNKSFGQAQEFVWGADASEAGVRESGNVVKVLRNFKEVHTIKPGFPMEQIYGGTLLAIRAKEYVCFYDYASATLIRRIDVPLKDVAWSSTSDQVAVISDASFFLLALNRAAVEAALENGQVDPEEGVEDAFEVVAEVEEGVKTCCWVGDCFIYVNAQWRLNYCVGGEVTTLYHLDRPQYLLGYMASQNRLYLIDKEYSIVSYTLLLAVLEYKTLVMRGDLDAARDVLPNVPKEQLNSIAKFLEAKGHTQEALELATDPDYRLELAIQLRDLATAQELAAQLDNESRWRQLGELALNAGKFKVAEQSLVSAKDLGGLLLLYSSLGQREGLERLARLAEEQGKSNVQLMAHWLLGDLHACVRVLTASGRVPEAAFFARTYLPSQVPAILQQWKAELQGVNAKAAEALADPDHYPDLFPYMGPALQAEQLQAQLLARHLAAADFATHEGYNQQDLVEVVERGGGVNGQGGGGAADLSNGQAPAVPDEEDVFVDAGQAPGGDNGEDSLGDALDDEDEFELEGDEGDAEGDGDLLDEDWGLNEN